jgi:(R,R)-butanediol dehydrogenase/meso-butanediol dehydrogenase/diacetyl reductase
MNTVTMKAARYYAANDIRVEETSIPSINKNLVKIEVKYAGICGSDLHEYSHGPIVIPMKVPYPINGHCGVTIMGHEFSGVVVEVGDDVHSDDVKTGDRVVVEPLFRNPDSFFTAKGEYNLSEPAGGIGLTGNGGFAKYVVVEKYMVHKIPDSVTFEQGALVEPAAVAVYAVKASGLQLGKYQYPTVRSSSL